MSLCCRSVRFDRRVNGRLQALDQGQVAVEDGIVPEGGDPDVHRAADLRHAVAVHLGKDLLQVEFTYRLDDAAAVEHPVRGEELMRLPVATAR